MHDLARGYQGRRGDAMEIRTIAVGIDFSSEAELALAQAGAIARRLGAALALIHVGAERDVLDGGLLPEGDVLVDYERIVAEGLAAERAELEALCRRHGDGLAISAVVVEGYPDTGLVEAAAARGADLLVVGTHGRSGLGRVLLGSVAERVVRLATHHVMVVRGPVRPRLERILVPVDFSPETEHAVALAEQLVADGGVIELLHAWQLPALAGGYLTRPADHLLAPIRAALEASARQRAAPLLARPRRAGGRTELRVVQELPGRAIAERARDFDLVVVGSHGRRGVRRWLLGSVAEETVRHAACSVLVAVRPAGAG